MSSIISIKNLTKRYEDNTVLKDFSLEIEQGEILALLGPNGAGKTTLISIICGLVNASSGTVLVGGYDNVIDFRLTREKIGLVPQELMLGVFDRVIETVKHSRGLFGRAPDHEYITQLLDDLSLGDKKNSLIQQLSGGMKRRVLIAKALSHQPPILFLDEPTAGVDVELRKDMWRLVEDLRKKGVTIILTTHYIEEAEAIADRVGVISKGELIVVDEKKSLMRKLGKNQLRVELNAPLQKLPDGLDHMWELSTDGVFLTYTYSTFENEHAMNNVLEHLHKLNLPIKDLTSVKSSLEDIFVNLVK